ncbi:MAG TPA: TRASH domain protein [Methylomirabilota bacterium]|nr:TRASH domain protein [Methylomirabilota bacterium]
MRGLILLAALALLVSALWPLVTGWARRLPGPREGRRDELVKDPVCGTYVLKSRAVQDEAGGLPVYFCSRECAARFAARERRA